MLDYLIKIFILFCVNLTKIYDIIRYLFINIQIVKVKTNYGYCSSKGTLYIKFFVLNLLCTYNEILPSIIKGTIKYLFDSEAQIIQFRFFNGKNSFNKIIETARLYDAIKLFKNEYIQNHLNLEITLPNLVNIQSILIIEDGIPKKNILPKVLQYMFQKNKLLYVILFENMIEQYEIGRYSICFEKLDDNLISVKKIIIPLKELQDETIDEVLEEICVNDDL